MHARPGSWWWRLRAHAVVVMAVVCQTTRGAYTLVSMCVVAGTTWWRERGLLPGIRVIACEVLAMRKEGIDAAVSKGG